MVVSVCSFVFLALLLSAFVIGIMLYKRHKLAQGKEWSFWLKAKTNASVQMQPVAAAPELAAFVVTTEERLQ